MNFGDMVKLVSTLPCFDLALLTQAFDDRRETIRVQLSRWMAQGKVIGLRRGLYTLSGTYRQVQLEPAALAHALYRPSYLSGLWALGHYDLIPERVVRFTSVTSRVPRRFENPFGVFDYRNVKQAFFFGYRAASLSGSAVAVAEPEKALLDHWHLSSGEWTEARLAEMRYQNMDQIDVPQLMAYAARFHSPRLDRAARRWSNLAVDEAKGTVTL